MLPGQRPPFALLARAIGADAGGAADIPPAVSSGFVVRPAADALQARPAARGLRIVLRRPLQVATPRVRSATKPAIPRLSDHVSKLNGVGSATQVGAASGPLLRQTACLALLLSAQPSVQATASHCQTPGPQAKLRDLRKAASEAGAAGLELPLAAANTGACPPVSPRPRMPSGLSSPP